MTTNTELYSTKSALRINKLLNAYQTNGGLEHFIKEMVKHGPEGLTVAGEILTYEAHETNDSTLLYDANSLYEQVIDNYSLSIAHGLPLTIAKIRKAHLPLDFTKIVLNELPNERLARISYDKTLFAIGDLLVESQASRKEIPESYERNPLVKGLVSEIGSLLLLERIAINKIGSESWFPFWTTVMEDRKKIGRKTHSKKCWDISIYSDLNDLAKPIQKLQIKSKRHPEYMHRYNSDILLIQLDPHLSLDPIRERNIGHLIIDEALRESHGDYFASAKLEQRTEQMLDILDS